MRVLDDDIDGDHLLDIQVELFSHLLDSADQLAGISFSFQVSSQGNINEYRGICHLCREDILRHNF